MNKKSKESDYLSIKKFAKLVKMTIFTLRYYDKMDALLILHGVGSEQSGFRPILIVQNDLGNKHSNTVIAAIIAIRIKNKANLPTHYTIKA